MILTSSLRSRVGYLLLAITSTTHKQHLWTLQKTFYFISLLYGYGDYGVPGIHWWMNKNNRNSWWNLNLSFEMNWRYGYFNRRKELSPWKLSSCLCKIVLEIDAFDRIQNQNQIQSRWVSDENLFDVAYMGHGVGTIIWHAMQAIIDNVIDDGNGGKKQQ